MRDAGLTKRNFERLEANFMLQQIINSLVKSSSIRFHCKILPVHGYGYLLYRDFCDIENLERYFAFEFFERYFCIESPVVTLESATRYIFSNPG